MAEQQTRTASQHLDDQERGLMELYQTVGNMARNLATIKEAIKLLGNKLDSVVKASASGQPITDEVISKIMVDNNVEELKGKVNDLIAQGILVASDVITANSFVVGRELDEAGAVQNPRMQFVVSALQPDVGSKFPGAKAGDTLELQEGKWKFEVQEVYAIATPSAPSEAAPQEAPAAPTAEATAPAVE